MTTGNRDADAAPAADWIDVTVPLRNGVVAWPGTPEYRIERICDVERGDPFTASRLSMSTHPERVTAAELERHDPRPGERLLLRTRNSEVAWPDLPFSTDYVHVAEDAAELLAQRGVRTVGIDHLSVGPYEGNGRATHLALLTAGILIIEGLRLSSIPPGEYELICLPLKLVGADGGPARVLLRPLGAPPTSLGRL